MRRIASVLAGAAVAAGLFTVSAGATELPMRLPTPVALPQQLRAMLRPRAEVTAPRTSSLSRFDLDVKGYRVTVAGVGDSVVVEVERKHHPKYARATTDYLARGTVSTRRVAASFGGLGNINVRFRPSGQVRKSGPRRHCIGPDRYTSQLGVFVGKIRFAGEADYLSANAHRAKGRVRYPLSLRCRSSLVSFRPRGGSHRRPPKVKPALFGAIWRHALDSTIFIAVRGLLFSDLGIYLALTEHSSGRVAVLHKAEEIGLAKSFTLDNPLTRASLKPSDPFAGAGRYSAAPDGTKTWTGSLRVSFPGAPGFPLTGPQFETVLEAGF